MKLLLHVNVDMYRHSNWITSKDSGDGRERGEEAKLLLAGNTTKYPKAPAIECRLDSCHRLLADR